MKRLCKIILGIITFIILVVVIMAVFRICPPPGPWPMPPWCSQGAVSTIPAGTQVKVKFYVTIPYTLEADEPVYLAVNGQVPLEMKKTGKLRWETEINTKTGQELQYNYLRGADRLPSESFTATILTEGEKVCDAVTKWEDAAFKPIFATGTTLGVNMFDTWGRNYNMRMFEDTRNGVEASFSRLEKIGANEVYVHDFLRAVYEKDKAYKANSTEYKIEGDIFANDQRDEEMNSQDLVKLADAAHARNLKIAWRSNFTVIDTGKYIGSPNIGEALARDWQEFDKPKTKEWVEDYFNKWEQILLKKTEDLNKAGFDIMIITPHFMNPEFHPEEDLANKRWKETIGRVKKAFKGKVGVLIHRTGYIGESSRDNWERYDYYKDADLVYYSIEYILPKYKPSANPDFTEMKDKFSSYLDELERKAAGDKIKISLIFGFPSYKGAVTTGYAEFNDVLNPAIKALQADYEHQAEATEAILQALEERKQFEKIILFGYWWDDVTDQDNNGMLSRLPMPRISISPSPRNKPAEAVFKKWCMAWR